MCFLIRPRKASGCSIIEWVILFLKKHSYWQLTYTTDLYTGYYNTIHLYCIYVRRDGTRQKKFTRARFKPNQFYTKKCINYDKSNLRENSVKGPKDPNSAKKMPKNNMKFQNVLEKCHQKTQNRNITHSLNKTAKFVATTLPKMGFFLH